MSAETILHRSAMAAEQLSLAGAPVVAAVRSRVGALVESVDDYCITAVALADGEVRDEDTANRSTAADWGAALAELHLRGAAVDLAQLPAAFLASYRRRRPITDQELTWLPLFARAAALETLRGLAPVLAHPAEPSWPAWATELDERIRTRADDLSAALFRRS